MHKFLIISILAFSIFNKINAGRTIPQPLRKLIMESEVIVIADVVEMKYVKRKGHSSYIETRAVLSIKELFKGDSNLKTIEVWCCQDIFSPQPARYKKSTSVLAFLDSRKGEESYITHGMTYGVKIIDSTSASLYKEFITDVQSILNIKDKGERLEKTVNWLIKCTSHVDLRWDGMYELSPYSYYNVIPGYIDQSIAKYQLSKSQIAELRNILFKIKRIRPLDLGLIDLVQTKNDSQLLEFLISNLKEPNLSDTYLAFDLMGRIVALSDRKDLRHIFKKRDELDLLDNLIYEKEQQIILEFVKKI